jgi:NAD(P)-dependent dehydrogenase (short-subunit alcohol dehydrogenase family)
MRLTDLADVALDRTVLPGYSRIGPALRRRWWPADPEPDALRGRHVVVTRASGGLGAAAATGIAALGATVHLVGRKADRLADAAERIRRDVPSADLREEVCDVSDLDDVRRYAARLTSDLGALHAVVHDAGVLPPERTETAQGHELTLATHVLGPLLLTELVRPLLEAADDGRVVWVSSGGMYTAPLTPALVDDLQFRDGTYDGVRAYARTKRLQVVVADLLAERHPHLASHSMHPGWADTPGVTDSLPGFARVTAPVLRTAEEGADTMVWLVGVPTSVTGSHGFWCDRRRRPERWLPWSQDDPALRRRAWDRLAAWAGLEPEGA